jgi:hypothetical protein
MCDCFVHLFKGGSPRAVAQRGVSAFGVSFVNFSLRLLCQRKVAKNIWYL